MKNSKHRPPPSTKTRTQANYKRAQRKSDSQAKRKTKRPKCLTLRFSPTAWAKLLYFRDKTDNEVGGFGITEPDDLLFIRDFVTVKQEVTCVSVEFDDTGTGISPEIEEHLFEPFHTTKPDGLGLGLFISQNIVHQHGGNITVHSLPGEGATFTVWLPL